MSGGRESGGLPTELGEDDEVLGVALRAGHARRAVAALLLVHPALQARLVHPLGGAPAAAWPDPLGSAVVLVGGEAHPAAPGTQADVQRWSGDTRPEGAASATHLLDQTMTRLKSFHNIKFANRCV